ncbi:MAG: peptidase S1 [Alphaproteobacteria bacterium]|nr:peptidase S1 [Alphaproteobacteria bacterium]
MKKAWQAAAAAAAIFAAASGAAHAQNYNQNPTYGAITLNAGFTPDPYRVNLQSGGQIDSAQTIGGACRGYIANAPDYRVSYMSGSLPLIISVNSSADTTLVVNGPDGQWYCDDDSGNQGLNPSLRWNSPPSGQYDIWVGTFGNNSLQAATLTVSELYTE